MSPALSTPNRLSPTIIPTRRARRAAPRVRAPHACRALVVPVPDDRAEDDREGRGHRQVDADADRERRNAQSLQRRRAPRRSAMTPSPTSSADADHLPVQAAADDALRERRDERRLRRRQRIRGDDADVRRAGESVGLRQQVQHRRDHRRAGRDADDQRDLLAPSATRRRAGRSSGPAGCRSRSSRRQRRSPSRRARRRPAPAASPASARTNSTRIVAQRHDRRGCRRRRSGCSTRRSGRPCSRRSPAIRKPPISTNGTAMSVSVTRVGVERRAGDEVEAPASRTARGRRS